MKWSFVLEDVIRYLEAVNESSRLLDIKISESPYDYDTTEVIYYLYRDIKYVTKDLAQEIDNLAHDPREGIWSVPPNLVSSVIAQRILEKALDEMLECIRKEALGEEDRYRHRL